MIVAEGQIPLVDLLEDSMLQWGRNLIVAEGAISRGAWQKGVGFNGAAT